MQEVLNSLDPKDVNLSSAYQARYDTSAKQSQKVPSNVEGAVTSPQKFISFGTSAKGEKEEAYLNYVNPETGILVASYNYANKEGKGPTGTTRINNSEILFQQYSAVARPTEMREVLRSSIENKETMRILELCFNSIQQKVTETEFMAGTDEFFALLATDNCKGVTFMLKDHPQAFGFKTISSIVTGGISYIRIKLAAHARPIFTSVLDDYDPTIEDSYRRVIAIQNLGDLQTKPKRPAGRCTLL